MHVKVDDPIPWNATWGPGAPPPDHPPENDRWVWEWDGSEDKAPLERILIEEPLGPYERKLLLLNRGKDIFYQVVGKPGDRTTENGSDVPVLGPEEPMK